MKLVTCPICRAANIANPGTPPGKPPYDFNNRCTAHALSGEPGVGGRSNTTAIDKGWYRPKRHSSKVCGAALTTKDGECIDPVPFETFVEITRRPFEVHQLAEAL